MKKVLFDTRAWCLDVLPQMQKYFAGGQEYNIQAFSVYHNKLEYKKYRQTGDDEDLGDYFEEGRKKYSKEDLIGLEKKYNLVNLWNVVYFDRFLKNKNEEFIIEQLSYYFYAWEQILSKHRPDFAVSETVVGAWNYVLFGISKHYNCQFLGLLFTKNSNRYFFSRDMFGVFPEMTVRFNQLQTRDLSAIEKQEAEKYSGEFVKNVQAPAYLQLFSNLPSIRNFFNPYRISINVYKDIRTWWNVKNDIKIDYRLNAYYRDFKRLQRVARVKMAGLFEKSTPGEKFVLFPLHFQPEASTEVCAAYYNDQYNVIVNLVRSLPFGYKLYVKEHYAVMGTKPISFYKAVKQLPNVKLIDAWEKIGTLIHSSSAVAVLTGTTGLEAIICKKPVIIFGHVFYDIYPQLYRVNDLEKLPELIGKALNDHRVDEIQYLKYISAYINSGYEGRLQGGKIPAALIPLHCKNLAKEMSNPW